MDFELVDLFNWQEKVKDMLSQQELTRRVSAQSETIERYIRDGMITPDLEIPLSEYRSFRYFNKSRPEEYAKKFGWKVISSKNMKDMFMDMSKKMTMSYSYKPVFIRAFLEQMNDIGEANLEHVAESFANFYKE